MDPHAPFISRNTDPETSHQAAYMWERHSDREEVLAVHLDHPFGLTDFECAAILHWQPGRARKRRSELRNDGYLRDSGLRRLSPSGVQAIVWCFI